MRRRITCVGLGLIALLSGCQRSTNHFNGYIEGDNTYISAPVSGRLKTLLVKKGNYVNAGQLVAELNYPPLKDDLHAAESQLAQVQAELANALTGKRKAVIDQLSAETRKVKSALAYANLQRLRLEKLVANNDAGQDSLDAAVSTAKQALASYESALAAVDYAKLPAREHLIAAAKAQVAATQAAVAKAAWHLQQARLIAPVTGMVNNRYYLPGEWINAYHPVLSILAKQNIKALFFVPEANLSQMRIHQVVWLGISGRKKRIAAEVRYISPKAEYTPPVIYSQQSKSKLVYRIEAAIKDPKVVVHPGQVIAVTLSEQG